MIIKSNEGCKITKKKSIWKIQLEYTVNYLGNFMLATYQII